MESFHRVSTLYEITINVDCSWGPMSCLILSVIILLLLLKHRLDLYTMARNFFQSVSSRSTRRRHSACARSHNAAYSRLYSLSEDLLHIIKKDLSFEASVAMTLSCARFYHSAVFADIRRGKSLGEIFFTVPCLLEYDGHLNGYCCRGCSNKHSSASFSCEELKKPV